ncbi:hypothetical protein ACR75N_04905 [Parabacteroides merdae]|uniref:hypothetical protein n=1 Tax=Parabacteroides merdae TaxID=46503 RepID=UPI003DA398EA
MEIFDKTGRLVLDVKPDDNSYRLRSIMANNSVTLQFVSTKIEKIPIGSYIDYMGERYTLYKHVKVTKSGKRNYSYTANFAGVIELLKKYMYKFLSSIPFELKFTLTAKPIVFLQLLVDNLNLHDSGWSVGSCVDMTEIVLSFNHNSCYDVLNTLADKCKTEWSFEEKKLSLCKLEKFKEDPLLLSYGLGNGLKPGIQKQPAKDVLPPTVLYVQGGDRNISFSKYGSKYLKLPISQELIYNGRKYITDKDGMFITRSDRPLTDVVEASFDGSEYYPKRIGTVTKVETSVVDGQTVYDIIDSSIPVSLDFELCLMDAETMTIVFQTGALTGKEFDVKYIHADRRFKIVSQNADDMILPGTAPFVPAVGDTYAVFHINLPDDYICNNSTQSGASWDMFREAARVLYESEDIEYSFKGSLDGLLTKENWLSMGGKIVPGGYVQFADEDIQEDPILIRIISVKDYLTRPYSPEIELSNKTIAPSIGSELDRIDQNEVKNEDLHNGSIQYTKRRFRDAKETQEMLEKAFDNFSEGINPIWVQTMSLLVGEESLQFRFVNSKTYPVVVEPNFVYNQSTKVFTAPKSILQHMTLGIKDIKSEHKASEYKFWDISALTSPSLGEFGALYLYARCSKTGTTGTFKLSETAYKMDPGDGYYYFLVGTLGTESDGARSFATVYGFTEVLPGRITCDRLISTDGTTYFNLALGEIGGRIKFASGSTGYNNISDKPDLGIYGTKDMLNAIQSDLQNQIDDKIETYYGTSNPWNSWPSGTEPAHVGDLWYNTSTKILQRYVGPSSNTWARIEDAAAIAAADAASNAQDTADGKRRVFLSTPYPPYDAGDQWIQYGGKGDMRICVRGRQSGYYSSSDWVLSSADGNTQASVDRGIFTAAGFLTFGGTAGLVGDGNIRIWSGGSNADNATFQVSAAGEVMAKKAIRLQNQQAGITGEGTSATSVRFWAGDATPANAPFKVYQNGNGLMGGLRLESGGLFSVDNKYGFDSSAKFFLHSQGSSGFLGFSSTGKWAGIGLNTLPTSTGTAALLRLEDSVSSYGTKYGAVISVSGGSHNLALLTSGHVRVRGSVIADTVVAAKIRAASNINADGSSYSYLDGVTFGYNDYDLDKVRFQVQNGIIVGVKHE